MTTTTHTIRNSFFALIPVATLAFAASSWASPYEVRAGFPKVPGADELESGQVDSAISKLESQLGIKQSERKGSVLTTLCAAYIMKGDLESATATCEEAVQHDQRTAYNNRGVLRALQGDFAGAEQDFQNAAQRSFSTIESKAVHNRRETAKRNAQEAQQRFAARKQRGEAVASGNQ